MARTKAKQDSYQLKWIAEDATRRMGMIGTPTKGKVFTFDLETYLAIKRGSSFKNFEDLSDNAGTGKQAQKAPTKIIPPSTPTKSLKHIDSLPVEWSGINWNSTDLVDDLMYLGNEKLQEFSNVLNAMGFSKIKSHRGATTEQLAQPIADTAGAVFKKQLASKKK
jgi:hypothetical protein